MICYMDKTWCSARNCKHFYECEKSEKYAMRKQDEHILMVSNASVDLTDYIIEDVRHELKKPLESVLNCNE